MSILELNSSNFNEIVEKSDKLLVIDFWATWCGPCRSFSPVLDEIAQENENVQVCKVNVDEEKELAMKYQVMSIPTLVFIKNGQLLKKSTGAIPKEEVVNLIEQL